MANFYARFKEKTTEDKLLEVIKYINKVHFLQEFYTCTVQSMSQKDKESFDLHCGADLLSSSKEEIDAFGLISHARLEYIFVLNEDLFNHVFDFGEININLDFTAQDFIYESPLINFETNCVKQFVSKLHDVIKLLD